MSKGNRIDWDKGNWRNQRDEATARCGYGYVIGVMEVIKILKRYGSGGRKM